MRILHIVGTMSIESGGPAEAVRMLVEFAPAGVESEIVTCDFAEEPSLAGLPCPVHALGHTRPGFYRSRKLFPWLVANRSRFDGVFVHGLWTYPGYAAWRALAGHTPYAVFAHGMLDPWFKQAFPRKHAKKWLYWLGVQYWALRRAHRVVFTTKSERDLARTSFWLSHWTPQVVSLGTRAPAPATAEAREAFLALCPGVHGQRFLLFLGRIDPKKGCDLLLQAFAQFASEEPALHLVMAGPDPGEWRAQLKLLIPGVSDRVHWPGMVKDIAKAGAFDLSEAFILPSHQENFGIAVVESLAAARPVLISDKVNIADEIAADGCGFVEADTMDGTLRLLRLWHATEPAQREAMRVQALESFQNRYDMQRNTAAILNIFRPRAEAR